MESQVVRSRCHDLDHSIKCDVRTHSIQLIPTYMNIRTMVTYCLVCLVCIVHIVMS